MSLNPARLFIALAFLYAGFLSSGCAAGQAIEKNGSGPNGRYIVCMLPLSREGQTGDETRRLTESLISSLDEADDLFQAVPLTELEKKFPRLKSMGDYEVMDYAAIRREFNADIIVVGTIEPVRVVGLSAQQSAWSQTPISISLERISAHSGKSLLAGRLHATRYTNRTDRTITLHINDESLDMPAGSSRERFEKANAFRGFLAQGLAQFKSWERCDGESEKEIRAIWEDGISSSEPEPGFEYSAEDAAGSFVAAADDAHFPHFLHRPPEFEKTGWSYPLLIYLHGTRASNDTLSARMISESPLSVLYTVRNGQPAFDESKLKSLNKYLKSSFVLMPQAPATPDYPGWDGRKLVKLLAEVIEKYPIDQTRIYVTGISQGGFATWGYSELLPGRFAAIAPVCGGGRTLGKSCSLDTPVWAFHAYDDRVVNFTLQGHAFESRLRSRLGYGDVDLFANYPFQKRNPVLWPELREKRRMFCGYLCLDHTGAAEDYTLSVGDSAPGTWNKGVVYPTTPATFTLYARGGHCPWPYGNPDFYRWMYSQKLARVP